MVKAQGKEADFQAEKKAEESSENVKEEI